MTHFILNPGQQKCEYFHYLEETGYFEKNQTETTKHLYPIAGVLCIRQRCRMVWAGVQPVHGYS